MKIIYSFLVLILFINATLASDDEDYYEDMMDELLREGRRLRDSCYYNPNAQSLVLTAIGKSTEEEHDEGVPKVAVFVTISSQVSEIPAKPFVEKTLFDLLNDVDSEKTLNFFRTGIPYEIDLVRASALVHLSQFIKNNDLATILALTSFLDIIFKLPDPKFFDLDDFKGRLLKCETSHNQKAFIEAEKERYEPLK